ncbi:MAG: hypothetical protein FWD66_11660 [Paludibacter sp.]|nr:hypothetical protein [Paludibacter sp.]
MPFLLLMLLALIGIIVRPLTPKEKGHLDPDELAKYAQLGGSGKSVFNSTPPKKQQVGGFLWFS